MKKINLVYCIEPEQYDVFDKRINKPIYTRKIENGKIVGSMVTQEMDTIDFKKNPFTFFAPNNIGMLLSVSKKHRDEAFDLYQTKINPNIVDHSGENIEITKKEFLKGQSVLAADYIELIQISIVFAYTALEAFINISIPDTYEYETIQKSKGIKEIYNKDAIERWVPLIEKLSQILPLIYNTSQIEKEKFWSNLKSLEKLRHNIIHQKSIQRTEFYKDYFDEQVFKKIDSVQLALSFFYQAHSKENKANPLWPWVIGKEKSFPMTDYDQSSTKVIGNIHEGIKRK